MHGPCVGAGCAYAEDEECTVLSMSGEGIRAREVERSINAEVSGLAESSTPPSLSELRKTDLEFCKDAMARLISCSLGPTWAEMARGDSLRRW